MDITDKRNSTRPIISYLQKTDNIDVAFPKISGLETIHAFKCPHPTLFHYGCLKRLNELGILGYVYGISATSGGAITAALLLQNCSSHINKERNAYIYNWETFEKQLLNLKMYDF